MIIKNQSFINFSSATPATLDVRVNLKKVAKTPKDTEALLEDTTEKTSNQVAKITISPETTSSRQRDKSKNMKGKKYVTSKGKKLPAKGESNMSQEKEPDRIKEKESPTSQEDTGMRRRQRTIRPEEPFQEFTFFAFDLLSRKPCVRKFRKFTARTKRIICCKKPCPLLQVYLPYNVSRTFWTYCGIQSFKNGFS